MLHRTRAAILLAIPFVCFALFAPARADDKEPAAPPPAAPPRTILKVSAKVGPNEDDTFAVMLDFNDAPEAKEWALKAANYSIHWYPQLIKHLASEGFKPPREMAIVFKPMDGIAHTNGTTITVSSKWLKSAPDDMGMIAHEMVHVLQQYPQFEPRWLVEGVADYIRYFVVEPGSKRAEFDPRRVNYKSGYQPAAGMLNWLEAKRGEGTIAKLNQRLRAGNFDDAAFKEICGVDPEESWKQFTESIEKPK